MGNNIETSLSAEADENINTPIEIPVPPHVAAKLMERFGQATDQAESSPFAGIDVDALRPEILRVAASELDADEFAVFCNRLNGEDDKAIAKALKITAKAVAVLGVSGQVKVRAGLLASAFDALADKCRVANDAAPVDPFTIVRQWFPRQVKQTKGHQWVPLVVLLFLAAAADEEGRLTYSDAYRVVGFQPAVTEAIPILKGLGFVDSDGKNIRVKRTPIGVFTKVAA